MPRSQATSVMRRSDGVPSLDLHLRSVTDASVVVVVAAV